MMHESSQAAKQERHNPKELSSEELESITKKIADFNESVAHEGWRVVVDMGHPTPARVRGLRGLMNGTQILAGLCLNNSYYSRKNVQRLIRFAEAMSHNVSLFTTEFPAKHNYRAFGYEPDEIERNTRLDANYLRNVARDTRRVHKDVLVAFANWNAIYTDVGFIATYSKLEKLLLTHEEFREDVYRTTDAVFANRSRMKLLNSAPDRDEGVKYVMEELAFAIAFPYLRPESRGGRADTHHTYMYYESWPIYEKYIAGEYGGNPDNSVGYLAMRVEDIT